VRVEKLYGSDGEDLGRVGRPTGIDRPVFADAIDRGIPVISCLGRGRGGAIYNVNADLVATELAASLRCAKFILITDVPGVCRDPEDHRTLISSLREEDCRELIASGVIGGGMLPKVEACMDAVDRGVGKAHIISGGIPHAVIREVLTEEGVGTQILPLESRGSTLLP
jgi:acetylglutamate kinase